ncbi:universal stress protein UspA [Adhaeribacter aerolatus]|uniref:Universal stress protein UspA n=1 Tax=Adhaeribacter aerolatus TaxID=670289 RepID=A0A512AYC2_9BACT|nr:universal stress protein [Adhaeribacter aerolatus]GEO04715.1 universal stress protein UspA [Adhaeribacter aerolatus]
MKKILVPTDFSENAVTAANYAACLAKESGACLILLHTETNQVAIAESTLVMDPDPTTISGCKLKLEEQAQQIQAEYLLNQPIETLYRTGSLSLVLNQEIKNNQVDLVVMGTRGTTNFLGKLIGTNTAAFIKTAVCPVLVIPPKTAYGQIKRIGYAADFQSDERFFLHQLFQISEPLQAEVYVVNIKSERQLKTVTDDQVLYYIQKEFPESNLHINQIRENDVVKGLQLFAEQNDIQILAIAMQDRNFLEDFFHKSVSRQLALEAQVPVLALPIHPYTGQPKLNHQTFW